MTSVRWVIKPEDIMIHMDRQAWKRSFIGFDEEKNKLEVGQMNIDISRELTDLWQVYSGVFENLKIKEEDGLHQLVVYMKHFVDLFEEKRTIKSKMDLLRMKLTAMGSDCEDCEDCQQGDDE